jgi:hypothetical protein
MALAPVKATELFGDAASAKDAAVRMDEYTDAFNKSVGQSISDPSAIMAIKSGTSTFAQASGDPVSTLSLIHI